MVDTIMPTRRRQLMNRAAGPGFSDDRFLTLAKMQPSETGRTSAGSVTSCHTKPDEASSTRNR